MKKLFRTLLAVMIAVVMSFAVVAFAACGPQNEPGSVIESEPKPTPGLATGNAAYDSIIDTKFAAGTIESAILFGNESVVANMKVNADGSFADIEIGTIGEGYSYYFVRDWAVYGTFADEQTKDFTQAELDGYVDINQVLEAYLEFVEGESGMEIPAEIDGLLNLNLLSNLLVQGTLSGVNYAILSLADVTDSAVTADGTVTVNFNKMAYNMIQDVKAVLNSLNDNTTVSELLNNKILKKYLQILTELTTPQEIIDAVAQAVTAIGAIGMPTADGADNDYTEGDTEMVNWSAMAVLAVQQINTLLNEVKPDADSTVYDYILKIISSQELVDLINGAIENIPDAPDGVGLTKKISEYTLGEIVAIVAEEIDEPVTFNVVREMALAYIDKYTSQTTETELKITVSDDDWCSLKDLSIIYTYDENGLTAMNATVKFSNPVTELNIEATLTLSKTAYAASEFATLPAELPEIEDFEFGDGRIPGDDIIITPTPSFDGDITGKRVIYNDIVGQGYENITEEQAEQLDALLREMETAFENQSIYFDYDGTCDYADSSVYEQIGDTVYVAENEEALNGGGEVIVFNVDVRNNYLLLEIPFDAGAQLTIIFDIIV